jgi:membrane-associated phospholipid phosphatase
VKYFIILFLFAAFAAYVLWRLRPYIRGARRLFGALREVRRMQQGGIQFDLPKKSKGKKSKRKAAAANERLLRCAACGTWTPASHAVTLSAGATYCSHACLERAADSPQRARKSAS